MLGSLFGAEMPLAVRFFLAFLIVLGLIGVTAWAVRRFGSGRLGGTATRGRQPRLAVIDYASVDARRRLILVRRDNVEHLLMTGGPTDVVVEPNIVRAVPAAREVTLPRSPAAGTLPRAIPLPEAESNGSWPLQPEPMAPPAAPPRRAPRVEPIPEEAGNWAPQPHTETPPRPSRDTLAALAEDLAAASVPPTAPATPAPPRNRAATPRPEPRQEPRQELRQEPRQEPRVQAPPADAKAAAAADQSLAEMAQRLEAALRKPKTAESSEVQTAPAPARAAPAPEPTAEAEAAPPPPPPAPAPRAARAAEAKAARAETKAKEGKLYDTLEQEMASLLGRPAGKTRWHQLGAAASM